MIDTRFFQLPSKFFLHFPSLLHFTFPWVLYKMDKWDKSKDCKVQWKCLFLYIKLDVLPTHAYYLDSLKCHSYFILWNTQNLNVIPQPTDMVCCFFSCFMCVHKLFSTRKHQKVPVCPDLMVALRMEVWFLFSTSFIGPTECMCSCYSRLLRPNKQATKERL